MESQFGNKFGKGATFKLKPNFSVESLDSVIEIPESENGNSSDPFENGDLNQNENFFVDKTDD